MISGNNQHQKGKNQVDFAVPESFAGSSFACCYNCTDKRIWNHRTFCIYPDFYKDFVFSTVQNCLGNCIKAGCIPGTEFSWRAFSLTAYIRAVYIRFICNWNTAKINTKILIFKLFRYCKSLFKPDKTILFWNKSFEIAEFCIIKSSKIFWTRIFNEWISPSLCQVNFYILFFSFTGC